MLKYECIICDYITDRSYNLDLHKKSKKHKKNVLEHEQTITTQPTTQSNSIKQSPKSKQILVNVDSDEMYIDDNQKIFECEFCGNIFKHYQSLWKHRKFRCKENKKDTNTSKNDAQTISTLIEMNKQLLELARKNADVSEKNADVSIITAKSAKKSMSMMSHAMKHFANAPPIKMLEGKQALKLLTYDNKSKHSSEDLLIYHYTANTLQKYLGDMLVKEYKMKQVDQQSIWTTDASRLCFIVKQIIEGTGDDRWMNDRSGITITKLIIAPLLKKVCEMLADHIKKFQTEAKKEEYDMSNASDIMQKMYDANMIILEISQHELQKEILKYISPYFGFELK